MRPPADLDEDRVERLALLAHDLHPYRTLAGDEVLVVAGRDDDHPLSRVSRECLSEQTSMRPRHKAAENTRPLLASRYSIHRLQ